MPRLIQCISPIDGSVYAERTVETRAGAEAAVELAKDAQHEWSSRDLTDRISLVLAGINRLGRMDGEIIPELAHMMGRPVRYAGEFRGVSERASFMAAVAEECLNPTILEASEAFERRIHREPQGVVLVVAPWNYPYMTAINTIVPALIAGNAVILKHATQTLLAGERIMRAFNEAGLPTGLFQNLFLDHETTTQLIAMRLFGFVNFTGSVRSGRAIERAGAGTFTSIGLELGGKDPGYVMEDADVATAVDTLIDGAMFNSGQCCCGIERIYVTASLYDEFVDRATETVSNYVLGNPLCDATTLGPMASPRFAAEVRAQVSEAIRQGATPTVDPALFPIDDGGAYLAPQILTNVTHSMRVMREETFGPVVGIMKVADDAAALALMNDSPFGLTASLWTADSKRAAILGAQIDTGTVFMNRADYLDPSLVWSGRKDTGRGAALSTLGYQSVTRPKSYHFKKD